MAPTTEWHHRAQIRAAVFFHSNGGFGMGALRQLGKEKEKKANDKTCVNVADHSVSFPGAVQL